MQAIERAIEASFGQRGKVGNGFIKRGHARQVAPGDAHHLARAPPAQCAGQGRFVTGRGSHGQNLAGQFTRRIGTKQFAALDQASQQIRFARAGSGNELAGGKHAGQLPAPVGRTVG